MDLQSSSKKLVRKESYMFKKDKNTTETSRRDINVYKDQPKFSPTIATFTRMASKNKRSK